MGDGIIFFSCNEFIVGVSESRDRWLKARIAYHQLGS